MRTPTTSLLAAAAIAAGCAADSDPLPELPGEAAADQASPDTLCSVATTTDLAETPGWELGPNESIFVWGSLEPLRHVQMLVGATFLLEDPLLDNENFPGTDDSAVHHQVVTSPNGTSYDWYWFVGGGTEEGFFFYKDTTELAASDSDTNIGCLVSQRELAAAALLRSSLDTRWLQLGSWLAGQAPTLEDHGVRLRIGRDSTEDIEARIAESLAAEGCPIDADIGRAPATLGEFLDRHKNLLLDDLIADGFGDSYLEFASLHGQLDALLELLGRSSESITHYVPDTGQCDAGVQEFHWVFDTHLGQFSLSVEAWPIDSEPEQAPPDPEPDPTLPEPT